MNELSKVSTTRLEVGAESAGQRIDNYLSRLLKGVPKSHVYRILRSGEVRVNSGRVSPDYRIRIGDQVRIPPIRIVSRQVTAGKLTARKFEAETIYEDEALLVLNKPAGVAVHGGSGVSFGVVEQLRQVRPEAHFLELVHRLDRGTSGVLILAKKRSALTALHTQLREGRVRKYYLTLVHGHWRSERQHVKLALNKYVLPSGERRVSVGRDGLPSHTVFRLKRSWRDFSLLEAELKTGRTHQIRVHLSHLGFPIAGDDKYGDFALNRELARRGLKRMFLHACRTVITHPISGETLTLEAPLPADLQNFLLGLDGPARAS